MEITRVAKRKSNKKREHFNRPMDNLKHISIHIIGISEGQKREMVKCIWWNYDWKLPKPGGGNRYPGTGSIGSPKQDELEKTHIKTYHN